MTLAYISSANFQNKSMRQNETHVTFSNVPSFILANKWQGQSSQSMSHIQIRRPEQIHDITLIGLWQNEEVLTLNFIQHKRLLWTLGMYPCFFQAFCLSNEILMLVGWSEFL